MTSTPFTLGVASGDPDANSVVLWTRLATLPSGMTDDTAVTWQLAADETFAEIVAEGSERATAEFGYCVHAIATPPPTPNLDSSWMFYRFIVDGWTSPVGRTRLAPSGATESVTFATASCQNYEHGWYAAHGDIAAQRPDFVVWLGDYIYEGAASMPGSPGIIRSHEGPEPTDLASYRRRYERYKSDINLQAAHQVCPWFVIWDDHEVENNYAALLPQVAEEAAAFMARRTSAYQAWWEHQPVRIPPPMPDGAMTMYRQIRWGDLVAMHLLDGRQYRSDQACGDASLSLDPPCAAAAEATRTMLGAQQEQWLSAGFATLGTVWNVLAQQVVMAELTIDGAVLSYDQWDGYAPARQRLLATIAERGIGNVVVLSGDIHMAMANVIHGPPALGSAERTPLAVELVCTSISSISRVPAELTSLVVGLDDVVDAELAHRGYILHRLDAQRWSADYRIVDNATATDTAVSSYRQFIIPSGQVAITPVK